MIRRLRFRQIDMEVKDAINELFDKAENNNNENNYFLFLSRANFHEHLDKNIINPYIIDYAIDRYRDEGRLKFLIDYLNGFYNFSSVNTADSLSTISIELMIYCHIWESKPFLKQLKKIANIIENKPYDWTIEIPEFSKHDFIRNEIKKVFKYSKLKIADVISKSYHSQLRNAFAHSDYDLLMDVPRIDLFNYKGKYWELKNIGFDDWTERFCYSFLLAIYFENIFHERRIKIKNDSKFNVILKNNDGEDLAGILSYKRDNDYWYASFKN